MCMDDDDDGDVLMLLTATYFLDRFDVKLEASILDTVSCS